MPLIRNASKEVLEWASHKMGCEFVQPALAFGITDRHGTLVGAVIWNDCEFKNVEMTGVGRGAFHKNVAHELMSFAFDELGCNRISITIRADNEYLINIMTKIGWKIEGIKRQYYEDCDAMILGVLKEECLFYAIHGHGRRLRSSS